MSSLDVITGRSSSISSLYYLNTVDRKHFLEMTGFWDYDWLRVNKKDSLRHGRHDRRMRVANDN